MSACFCYHKAISQIHLTFMIIHGHSRTFTNLRTFTGIHEHSRSEKKIAVNCCPIADNCCSKKIPVQKNNSCLIPVQFLIIPVQKKLVLKNNSCSKTISVQKPFPFKIPSSSPTLKSLATILPSGANSIIAGMALMP